jgi:ATP-binding cassette, subfamily G (WHITE), member 2
LLLVCRERNDGLYRPITYLVAKMIEELTIFFFLSLLLTSIVFHPCKLGGEYLVFWLCNLVTTATGIGENPDPKTACLCVMHVDLSWCPCISDEPSTIVLHQAQIVMTIACCGLAALGYFIAAVSPNMDVANAALPAYVTVLLFFVGLLLRPQDQPKYWSWFAYIDFLKYAWAAQMVNQYEHQAAYISLPGHVDMRSNDITGQILMGDGKSVSHCCIHCQDAQEGTVHA